MKRLRKHGFLVLVILGVVFWGYYGLPRGFFEQDEWHSFGHYIELGSYSGKEFWGQALRSGPLTHFTPLALFFKMGLFSWFGLAAKYYFWVSMLWHGLVALAVYWLIFLVLQKKLPALVGGVFFAVNSSHHQAVTWLGNFEGTEGATLFGVLSLICFWEFTHKKKKRFLILALGAILVSLLFKEVGLTFGLVLAGWMIAEGKRRVRSLLGLVAVGGVWVALRFLYLVFGVGGYPAAVAQGARSFLLAAFYNVATLPVKLFSQVVIPQVWLVDVAKRLALKFGANLPIWRGPWVSAEAIFYDAMTVVLGLLILILVLVFLARYSGEKRIAVCLGMGLVILTAVPVLILKKYLVVLDSRFLYPATVGVGMILAIAIERFWREDKGGQKNSGWTKVGVGILVLLLLGEQMVSLRGVVGEVVAQGEERLKILEEIKEVYPDLPEKTVFFTESDTSYYGLPPRERILPFQSGLGQVLLVWYDRSENWPREFFQNEFLWGITDQGYEEAGGRGFGYFREVETMMRTMRQRGILGAEVIGFRYDSGSGKLSEMTEEVRGGMEGWLVAKREVSSSGWKVFAFSNLEAVGLAIDGKRETVWDSKLPYGTPQFFEVNLGRERKIAEVMVDSYNDRNQNEVGYRVLLSEDGKNYRQSFFAKRYPPDENGLVRLYFKPQLARYIRLEQVGFHPYASWIIGEISVYEVAE